MPRRIRLGVSFVFKRRERFGKEVPAAPRLPSDASERYAYNHASQLIVHTHTSCEKSYPDFRARTFSVRFTTRTYAGTTGLLVKNLSQIRLHRRSSSKLDALSLRGNQLKPSCTGATLTSSSSDPTRSLHEPFTSPFFRRLNSFSRRLKASSSPVYMASAHGHIYLTFVTDSQHSQTPAWPARRLLYLDSERALVCPVRHGGILAVADGMRRGLRYADSHQSFSTRRRGKREKVGRT